MSVTSCGLCHSPVMNDKGPIGDVVDAFVYKYGELQYIELFHRQCAIRKGYKVDRDGHLDGLGPRGADKLNEGAYHTGKCEDCNRTRLLNDKDICDDCHRNRLARSGDNWNEQRQVKTFAQHLHEATESIPDLRKDYDEKADVIDGHLYRKGLWVQVWWDRDDMMRPLSGLSGRESWHNPDLANAKRNFRDMKQRWNEVDELDEATKGNKRCVLCKCGAVAQKYGFPVCQYHQTHGEDDPPCPDCDHPPHKLNEDDVVRAELKRVEYKGKPAWIFREFMMQGTTKEHNNMIGYAQYMPADELYDKLKRKTFAPGGRRCRIWKMDLDEAVGNCVLCYWDKVVDKNKYPLCHYHQAHKGMTEDSVVVQHEMSDTAPAVSKLETFKEHTSVAKAYKIDLFQVNQDALARELYMARKLKELRVYVAMKNGTRIEMTFDDAEQLRREYLGNIRSLKAYVQKRW